MGLVEITLASSSPRRKKALRRITVRFRTLAVREPKKARGKTPSARTSFLASAKCRSASRRFPSAIIIAADTLVSCRGRILGKPASRQKAEQMLELISGQRMDAATSIAVHTPERAKEIVWSEYGWVRFRKLQESEIKNYLDSGKWRGKAGAINVEEQPVKNWITKRGGEFDAVVGLPTKKLRQALKSD